MRNTAASLEHGVKATGKKTPVKQPAKKEEREDAAKPSNLLHGKVVKMPGGRVKGAQTSHQAKAQEDRDKKSGESSVEHVREDLRADLQQKQDGGDLMLQWGQRKRLRGRQSGADDSAGPLKKSIRVDRHLVRADKQVGAAQGQAQAAVQSRTNVVIPPTPSAQENNTLATGRRSGEGGNGATASDCNPCPSSSRQHTMEEADKARKDDAGLATTSGGPLRAHTSPTVRREADNQEDRPRTAEKLNLDQFEWPKIVIPLTRKEKEDDFMAIKGSKLSQRPKKRPKAVEKGLQFIYPGSFLCDMTPERYEVREKKSVKKQKPRGLKAMCSEDSDSD